MIHGQSVQLYPLSLNELGFLLDGTYENLSFDMSDFELTSQQGAAISKKMSKMKTARSDHMHYMTYHLIIEKESSKGLGLIGFKGIEEDLSVEVGYGICKKFEGKGLTSSALATIVKWAKEEGHCSKITAKKVLKSNYGSQRVLEKNGFVQTSQSDSDYSYERLLNHGGQID